jgi:hypothetical protein
MCETLRSGRMIGRRRRWRRWRRRWRWWWRWWWRWRRRSSNCSQKTKDAYLKLIDKADELPVHNRKGVGNPVLLGVRKSSVVRGQEKS